MAPSRCFYYNFCIGANVQLITKPRNIVNAELKDGQAKGGIKCISMAEVKTDSIFPYKF